MNRQEITQNLLQSMDSFGRVAASRSFEHAPKGMPTHAQIGVLMTVLHRGPQSITELAKKFRMTSSAATQLVNGLAKEGFLVRKEDQDDRRKIHVELTAKGRGKMAQIKKYRYRMMEKVFTTLTDTELSQLQKIQQKIVDHLTTLWNKKSPNK